MRCVWPCSYFNHRNFHSLNICYHQLASVFTVGGLNDVLWVLAPKYEHFRENLFRYVEQYGTNNLTINVNGQFNFMIKEYVKNANEH